jgi:hypothetical protein
VLGVKVLGKGALWSLASLVAVVPTVTMELAAASVLFVPLVSSNLFSNTKSLSFIVFQPLS